MENIINPKGWTSFELAPFNTVMLGSTITSAWQVFLITMHNFIVYITYHCNNGNTSAVKIIAIASFPPSATRIAAATRSENGGNDNQLQPERDLAIVAITIVTREQRSSETRTSNGPVSSTTMLTRPLLASLSPWRPSLQAQPE